MLQVKKMYISRTFSNFWRILEILLINCETNIVLACSASCVISAATYAATFAITDTKLYVPVVTG